MKRLLRAIALQLLPTASVLSLLIAPAVGSASAITYDFTGVVTEVSGFTGVTVGMPVTGTYTINLDNANPSQQIGTIGSTTTSWEAANYGGPKIGTPAPTLSEYVFSSTLQAGAVSYATDPNTGGYLNQSTIDGRVTAQPNYTADEVSYAADGSYRVSNFILTANAPPYAAPWTNTGLPIFATSNQNVGSIGYATGGIVVDYLQYNITSFTVANNPASQLAALRAEVTGVGPGTSLADKVTLAQTYYSANDIPNTCSQLTAFVNEVTAQNGKKISQSSAKQIVLDAQAIQASIGCK
jgi:hypothetical protein